VAGCAKNIILKKLEVVCFDIVARGALASPDGHDVSCPYKSGPRVTARLGQAGLREPGKGHRQECLCYLKAKRRSGDRHSLNRDVLLPENYYT
jgi:hypothetical protein